MQLSPDEIAELEAVFSDLDGFKDCSVCGEANRLGDFHDNGARLAAVCKFCRRREMNARTADGYQTRRNVADPVRIMYQNAKARAKTHGVPFSISIADVAIPDRCPVLGIVLNRKVGTPGFADDSPSLDRVVPELGYVPGNVVVMSMRANRLKSDSHPRELAAVALWYHRWRAAKSDKNTTVGVE
jgi:hypothetical protein